MDSYNSPIQSAFLAMRMPGTEKDFDEADSVLGRKRAKSPIDMVRRRRRLERAGEAQSESRSRSGFQRLKRHFSRAVLRELDWQESLVTAGAWLVMLAVLAALVYLVYATFRYAQTL